MKMTLRSVYRGLNILVFIIFFLLFIYSVSGAYDSVVSNEISSNEAVLTFFYPRHLFLYIALILTGYNSITRSDTNKLILPLSLISIVSITIWTYFVMVYLPK